MLSLFSDIFVRFGQQTLNVRHLMPEIPKETIVESSTALAATIRAAMRDRNLDRQGIAALLDIGDVMVDKLLCGDIVPSRNLEKQLIEKLGITSPRARRITERREQDARKLTPMKTKSVA